MNWFLVHAFMAGMHAGCYVFAARMMTEMQERACGIYCLLAVVAILNFGVLLAQWLDERARRLNDTRETQRPLVESTGNHR